MSVITQRKKDIEEGKEIFRVTEGGKYVKDFLGCLMGIDQNDKDVFSDEELRAEVDTFMFEGHDTTAHSLIWTLYNIALNRNVEQKLINEIDSVLGDKLMPDYEDLIKLKYTECIIKESLRLHPAVPVIARLLDVDTPIKDLILPKGTYVQIFLFLLHRHPDFWKDPMKFIPERWEKNSEHKIIPGTFYPFSNGPRSCIGKKFAQFEEKVTLSMIYKRFIPRLVNEDEKIEGVAGIILRPDSKILIKLFPR